MQYIHTYVSFDPMTRVISQTTRFFFITLDRKRLGIDSVQRIDALNRDSFTNDEVFVRFHTEQGGLVVSEFNRGFNELIVALRFIFSGVERWNDVTLAVPLTEATLLLWERDQAAAP